MALYPPFLFILLMLGIETQPIHFRKQMIAAESFESVGVFDVNNDQKPDLVSGAFWYEGPFFVKRPQYRLARNAQKSICRQVDFSPGIQHAIR